MSEYKVKRVKVDCPYTEFPYSMDVVDELTKMLSEELAKQIDREIISSLGIEDRKYRRKNSIKKIFNE
jgi:hypothetical protein